MKNLQQELQKLLELQEIDGKIYKLNLALEEIPEKLEKLKTSSTEKQNEIAVLKEEYNQTEVKRKEIENEIETNKEKIIKFNAQLYQLKNNTEYSAMLKQIEETKQIISTFEDEILIHLETLDNLKEKIKKQESLLKQEQEKTEEIIKEEQKKMENFKKEQFELQKQQKQKKQNINSSLLSKYEQILEKRKDSAIAYISNGCCSACNMSLQPEVANIVKINKELVFCGTCSRILYDKDGLK